MKGRDHDHRSIDIPVDVPVEKTRAEDYDALMIPGGVINSDQIAQLIFQLCGNCITVPGIR